MKTSKWIHTAIMTLSLAMAGCGKQSSVDTASFERSFKTAEAAVQTSVDKVVTAVKSADYSSAMAELKTLASNAKLTPEQQQTIKDVMAQVEKAISDAAQKAAGNATKTIKDIPKALPK
jgi:23S rRNA G2445 N2-methylase RlmL